MVFCFKRRTKNGAEGFFSVEKNVSVLLPHHKSQWGRDACLMSTLAPVESLKLLLTEKKIGPLEHYRLKVHPFTFKVLPFLYKRFLWPLYQMDT